MKITVYLAFMLTRLTFNWGFCPNCGISRTKELYAAGEICSPPQGTWMPLPDGIRCGISNCTWPSQWCAIDKDRENNGLPDIKCVDVPKKCIELLTAKDKANDDIAPGHQTTAAAPSASPVPPAIPGGECIDRHDYCCYWAAKGECDKNPFFMKTACQKSCGTCGCTIDTIPFCPTNVTIGDCKLLTTKTQHRAGSVPCDQPGGCDNIVVPPPQQSVYPPPQPQPQPLPAPVSPHEPPPPQPIDQPQPPPEAMAPTPQPEVETPPPPPPLQASNAIDQQLSQVPPPPPPEQPPAEQQPQALPPPQQQQQPSDPQSNYRQPQSNYQQPQSNFQQPQSNYQQPHYQQPQTNYQPTPYQPNNQWRCRPCQVGIFPSQGGGCGALQYGGRQGCGQDYGWRPLPPLPKPQSNHHPRPSIAPTGPAGNPTVPRFDASTWQTNKQPGDGRHEPQSQALGGTVDENYSQQQIGGCGDLSSSCQTLPMNRCQNSQMISNLVCPQTCGQCKKSRK